MAKNVKETILELLADRDVVRSRDVTERLGVSRQAAHYHLRRLVDDGDLERIGAGRGARYQRPEATGQWRLRYDTEGLEEDRVWSELAPRLSKKEGLTDAAHDILQYAVTELVNNAIDHSGAPEVAVEISANPEAVTIAVVDRGVGLFAHVQQMQGLDDEVAALLELTKGKLTTMPAKHSGEGLFFVSKAVDLFDAASGGLRWLVDNVGDDLLIEDLDEPVEGTQVSVTVSRACTRDLGGLFEAYTEDFELVRTRTVVKLFAHGVRFVSRSEAKRLVHGLERFREAILDFEGVRGVGQGFADEVFRVWASEHPEVELRPVNMGRAVELMVERARRAAEVNESR